MLATTDDSRSTLLGMIFMLAAAVTSSMDAVIVRLLANELHPFVIGFTRAFFGLVVFLPWIATHPGLLRSRFRFRHVLRAALKLAAMISLFFAFTSAPLADATAIAFASPIFVTIGAWVFLSELPRGLRVIGVLVGFAGVVVILQPTGGEVSHGLLFALLGAVLIAVIQLLLKPMSAVDSTQTLVAWNLIVTVPLAAVPAYLYWTTPSVGAWWLLAFQGVLGAVAMACGTRAFALAEASLISPLEFARLPTVAVLAFLIFGETAQRSTIIGGVIIFLSALLIAHSRRLPRAGAP